MGIELPPELRDVAAKVGLQWPEADEDAMRESAGAWREAATSIDSLSSSADGVAQGALASLQGESGDAAGREWNGMVGEDGPLRSSVKACTASADRLDHAAEQIGAAKVQMVRQLVDAAKQVDAAEQAAGSGNAQALAGLDTVLRGASVGVSETHATLSSAVDADSGVTMDSGSAPGLLGSVENTVSGVAGSAGDAVSDVAGGASGLAADTGEAVVGIGQSVGEAGGTAADVGTGLTEGVPGHGVAGAVGDGAATVGGALGAVNEPVAEQAQHAAGATESTMDRLNPGPVGGPEVGPPAGGPPGFSENTGPIPVGPSVTPGWGGGAESTGPVSLSPSDPVTSPQGVQSAWAAPPASAAAAVPNAPMPPQAPPMAQPPPQAGGFQHGGVAPPPAGGQQPGGVAAQPPPRPAVPYRPQQPGFGVVPQPPPQQPAPQVQQPPRAAARPPGAAVQPPMPHASAQQADVPRPPRTPARSESVVAFVLNQFPLGHMPLAAPRPSRQLPPPAEEQEPVGGVCFPPQDHPRSSLVDGSDAAVRARSGAAPLADGEAREVPAELLENHDPLGELAEVEWERRFLVEDSRDYVWRASARFPEGCVESGEPIVLDPDTVLDRFGTGAGRVFAVDGTAVAQRSLPPAHVERGYRRYRVLRPLPVWRAVSASWFAQPGGGVRYRATYSAAELVAFGFLLELTREVEASEAGTVRIAVENLEASQHKEGV
ncbi:DUF4237 domain-containing protein [Allosaccharopolyspora coralli]|uniref:DUF4237 domain-containing protein n=1 Tax=Allosaccharopolyspora coralli TaxID=2665642 RepID=A0A5Q3QDP2_9PSEU|nr:glycohydrolase toxin TNT-related protein [Allosaccharopolyspora coralli]QGK71324.1 DUF4237 domain-containing protein [Allosaccharopolyspora coralli]